MGDVGVCVDCRVYSFAGGAMPIKPSSDPFISLSCRSRSSSICCLIAASLSFQYFCSAM